jgi:hypothetical protein
MLFNFRSTNQPSSKPGRYVRLGGAPVGGKETAEDGLLECRTGLGDRNRQPDRSVEECVGKGRGVFSGGSSAGVAVVPNVEVVPGFQLPLRGLFEDEMPS